MRVSNLKQEAEGEKSYISDFRRLIFYPFIFSLLLLPLVPGGCRQGLKLKEANELGEKSSEQKKAVLLEELDRRFENPDAHYELGRLYQEQQRWPQAEYHYNIALSFMPAHRPAQAAMVKVLLESGRSGQAGHYADVYKKQAAGSAKESLRLGAAFQQQQLYEYAMECYQQALKLAPESAQVHRQLGYYYLQRADKERAREYLSRSFELNPRQADVAGQLGRLGVEVKIPPKEAKQAGFLEKIFGQAGKERID